VIAFEWPWALAGIAIVAALGVLFVVLVGLVGMPGDALRRLGQSATTGRTERGADLPGEVPAADAAETARSAGEGR